MNKKGAFAAPFSVTPPKAKGIYKTSSCSNHKPLPMPKDLTARFYRRDSAEERLREGKIYFLGAELIQKPLLCHGECFHTALLSRFLNCFVFSLHLLGVIQSGNVIFNMVEKCGVSSCRR